MIKERNIILETSTHWVSKEPKMYTVYTIGITHSVSDSSYSLNSDGLSLAIARCKYLTGKKQAKLNSERPRT